jgi:hypothetical protein
MEVNMKTVLVEEFCEGGIWIELDQDDGQWQVLVGPFLGLKLRSIKCDKIV